MLHALLFRNLSEDNVSNVEDTVGLMKDLSGWPKGAMEYHDKTPTSAWFSPWFTMHMKPTVRITSRTRYANSMRPSCVWTFEKSTIGRSAQSTMGAEI